MPMHCFVLEMGTRLLGGTWLEEELQCDAMRAEFGRWCLICSVKVFCYGLTYR